MTHQPKILYLKSNPKTHIMFLKSILPIAGIIFGFVGECCAQSTIEPGKASSFSGKNIISGIPFAANNHGLCFGLSYERFLTDDERVSLYIPVLYNQHAASQHESDTYSEKNAGFYLGLKYYTSRKEAAVRYSIGMLAGDVISFRHVTHSDYLGGSVDRNEHVRNTLVGFMFHNALNVNISKHFTYITELDLGIAGQANSGGTQVVNDEGSLPMVLLQMSIGYRF
jgi:hypothetical protein